MRFRKLSGVAAGLYLFVLFPLFMVHAQAADDGNTNKGELWRSVSRLRGRVWIEDRSGRNDHSDYRHWTVENTTQVQVDFTMERERPREEEVPEELAELVREMANTPTDESTGSSLSWRAVSAKITGVTLGTTDEAYPHFQKRFTTNAEFSGVPLFLEEFILTLDTETGVWQLVSPGRLREKYRIVNLGTELNTSSNESREINEVSEIDHVAAAVFDGKLSGTPGPVKGMSKVEQGGTTDHPTGWSTKIGRLEFWPEFDDVEVEITIDGYDAWRPLGSINQPTKPGNHLVARGTLVPKDGGRVQDLPKVKNFRFELLDTSREPGVCLNWPLAAKDSDYDLRLAAAPLFLGTLSNKDQDFEVTKTVNDDQGRPYAQAQIDSYDFGGRASLRVFCTLMDGREVEGVMKGEGGESMPRLPNMKGPGWIADSWRKAHEAEKLADNDDNEEVKGQQDNGDGYTLYEEYRGWVEDGKHIEGDPKRKDFFMLNLIKGDAAPGIELFEQLSDLRVHAKLKPSEMSETKRLMNGNHSEAPQRVEQHGVWIKQFLDDPPDTKDGKTGKEKLGDSGAATPMTDKGVAGRPGLVKGIGILARDNTESAFNQPFNLPAEDAIFAYDRAIAHELLHTVGVEHHGPDDTTGVSLSFVPPNVPDNKIGRPHFRNGDTVVNALEENGHDIAAQAYPVYIQTLQLLKQLGMAGMLESLYGSSFKDMPPGSQAFKDFVEKYIDFLARGVVGLRGLVGLEHGSHSGDQDCVMRYYFAKFYEAKNTKEKTLYFVTPGTERIGMQICRSGKGTGINASDHKPQSRYGDAASDNGNCFSQICPNDAIPPRKVK